MSELRRRYCIFGCDALVAYGVPLHRFPNPDVRPDLFAAWLAAVGSKVRETDRTKIYKNKRICDHHFDPTFKTTGGRLICSAIPTINLNRVQQTVSTFVETDHSYCRPRREFSLAGPMIGVTNLPESSVQTKYLPGSSKSGPSSRSTCLASSEKYHARTPMSKFDAVPKISPFVPDSQTSTTHEATLTTHTNTVKKEPSNLVYNKPKMVKRKIGNDNVELSKKLPKLEGKMKRAAKNSANISDDNCNMARPGIVIVVRPVAPGETAESRAPRTPTKTTEHGKDIHVALANCLQQIIVNGLNNNKRKALEKKYLTPENCPRMIPPLLNPELKAVLPEASVKRDRGIENRQKQLGTALSCLSDVINTKMQENDKDIGLLKQLMDAAKLVCDSLHSDSVERRSLALSSLKKDLRKDPLMQTKIDKYLFVEAPVLTLKTEEE